MCQITSHIGHGNVVSLRQHTLTTDFLNRKKVMLLLLSFSWKYKEETEQPHFFQNFEIAGKHTITINIWLCYVSFTIRVMLKYFLKQFGQFSFSVCNTLGSEYSLKSYIIVFLLGIISTFILQFITFDLDRTMKNISQRNRICQ